MDEQFWHRRWTKNEIGFHLEKPHHYLTRFFEVLQVAEGDALFVPMCGKSPDLLWLREQGVEPVGVEINPLAVEAFFEENRLPCEQEEEDAFSVFFGVGYHLYCGDLFAMQPSQLRGASAVYDRGALVALPAEMRARYAVKLTELLPGGSRVLLVSYEYDQGEAEGPPFAVPMPEVEALFGDHFAIELLASEDVLWSHQLLAERGISRLREQAILLERF